MLPLLLILPILLFYCLKYTLYQIYNKDKRFDDGKRVCEKAIDVLGFFSNDRLERWSIYLEKTISKQEKMKK